MNRYRRTRRPEWVDDILDRLTELEEHLMADISQAETDLAAAVSATATRVQTDIDTLQAEIAKLPDPSPELQAAADAIETQVAALAAVDPAAPPVPADAPAPADPNTPPA
jgi:phage shock protein A